MIESGFIEKNKMMRQAGYVERKHKLKDNAKEVVFKNPTMIMEHSLAISIVKNAFEKWKPKTKKHAEKVFSQLEKKCPNDFDPDVVWDSVSHLSSRDYFVWGHDHDFGFGLKRSGFMSTRHIEIPSEAMALGFLPVSLQNKKVMNIGTHTGGDLLVLAGLGADCIAIEEDPRTAEAAKTLIKGLKVNAKILTNSAFEDNQVWQRTLDYVYCSGVLYHVTDPVLLLRILFSYLKIGGELLIETKAMPGNNGLCSYSGVVEKGSNWYAPDELTIGRWFIDAGFQSEDVTIYRRSNGRLLVHAVKKSIASLVEPQGFSRPGSWLEKEN